MPREITTYLIEWADETGAWEYLARTCLEWLDEAEVKAMNEHHNILERDDDDE